MSFVFHGTLSLHGGCISSLSGVPLIVHAACILCSDPPHHQDRALKVKVLTLPGEYAPIYTQNTLAHVIGRVHPPLWGMDANVVIVATGIIPSPHTTLAAPGNGYNYHFVIVGTVMEQLANRRLSLGIGGPTALLPWTIILNFQQYPHTIEAGVGEIMQCLVQFHGFDSDTNLLAFRPNSIQILNL